MSRHRFPRGLTQRRKPLRSLRPIEAFLFAILAFSCGLLNRGIKVDDAHLMPSDCLPTLRPLFEDFPHSHNVFSLSPESPEAAKQFILAQLDRAVSGHHTFTAAPLALIVRWGEGLCAARATWG